MSNVAEREALPSALRQQREHVLAALFGLSGEQLRQPVLPSGSTCTISDEVIATTGSTLPRAARRSPAPGPDVTWLSTR